MRDLGACDLRPEGILDPDREAGFRRGIRGLGMDYLGAVVSQFNRFGKSDLRQRGGIRADARVGREHAVNIGPDPYFVRARGRADDGGGIIRSSAPQRSGLALRVRAAVARNNRHNTAFQRRQQHARAILTGRIHVRGGIAKVAVRRDHIFRAGKLCGAALLLQVACQHPGGDALTQRHQRVRGLGGNVRTQRGERLARAVQLRENFRDKTLCRAGVCLIKEFTDQLEVHGFKFLQVRPGGSRVAVPGSVNGLKNEIGNARHG